jgi:hypothetical protein
MAHRVVDIDICDTAFGHAPGASWYNVPKHVRWIRGRPGRCPIRFFTDRSIGQVENYPADVNVAWVIEPRCIDGVGHEVCLSKLSKFNYVLTYDEQFKQEVGEKALLYAIGGCWLRAHEICLHPKTELVSIIASVKRSATGHQLRHEVTRYYPLVHAYGNAYQPVPFKSEALAQYRYSVAIENSQVDTMFTEKIIDCFLTGTIPIYWGTRKIAEHFNTLGVLQFETLDELNTIMAAICPEDYASRLDAVKDNFERAMAYRVVEDWIFDKYPWLLRS